MLLIHFFLNLYYVSVFNQHKGIVMVIHPITLEMFATRGITEQMLEKYYHLKKSAFDPFVVDVRTLNWRVCASNGLGCLAAGTTGGPSVFPYVLFNGSNAISEEEAVSHAVRRILSDLAMTMVSKGENTEVVKLFKVYQGIEWQADRVVVKLGHQNLPLYVEPKYLSSPTDLSEYVDITGDRSEWIFGFFQAIYPKAIADKLHSNMVSLYKKFKENKPDQEILFKLKVMFYPAGCKVYVYIGEKEGYGFHIQYNSFNCIDDELQVQSEEIISIFRDMLN